MAKLHIIKTGMGDRKYLFTFGTYYDIHCLVIGKHLEDALDQAIDWIAEVYPGLLCNDEVNEEYARCIAEGMDEDKAYEESTIDTVSGGNCGYYLLSEEVHLDEAPRRAYLKALIDHLGGVTVAA